MEIEQKQADLIEHFAKQANCLRGDPLSNAIVDATSHPLLFSFSEILSVPNVAELEGSEYSVFLDMLSLFAHGTWREYKSTAGHLPALVPDQVRKLKQLSVLTLAETNKVLPYDHLMQELDVSNVQFAAGRDLRPGQLGNMIQILSTWLTTSDNLLLSIQEKMKWADTMGDAHKKHQKDIEDKVDEVKKSLKQADMELLGHEEIAYSEPGGVVDYEEDRIRPKRRRSPFCEG